MFNHYNWQHQKGFILPLLILMLITAGSGAVATLSTSSERSSQQSHAPRYLIAEQQLQQLYLAKQALIAYAVSYADNYGPGGAGPGHFPCPDLDAPDDGNPHNDGPDPPCGANDQQIGRVPRITLATRSAIADDLAGNELDTTQGDNRNKLLEFYPQRSFTDRQPWYWIDGEFINNPLNRIVSGDTQSSLITRQEREIIAVLLTPGQELNGLNQQRPGLQAADYVESVLLAMLDGVLSRDYRDGSNDLALFIYRDEVMPWVERRVAGFVAEKLRDYRERSCPAQSSLAEIDSDSNANPEQNNCYPFLAVPDHASAFDEDKCPPSQYLAADINTSAEEHLRYETCSDWLLHEGELQGVSQRRHWYFRNQWDQHITFSVAPVCLERPEAGCVISIGRDPGDEETEKTIVIIQPLLQSGADLHG